MMHGLLLGLMVEEIVHANLYVILYLRYKNINKILRWRAKVGHHRVM